MIIVKDEQRPLLIYCVLCYCPMTHVGTDQIPVWQELPPRAQSLDTNMQSSRSSW